MYKSSANIINTILWDNEAQTGNELYVGSSTLNPSTVTVGYSNIKGGQAAVYIYPGSVLNWETGMIDAPPLFIQGPEGDRYLDASSPCVDTGNQPSVNWAMHTCWTRKDELPDTGIVDIGFHYGPCIPPTLTIDGYQIPEQTGGTINYELNAGIDKADRKYILLGGVSGTEPGYVLPGGDATLPINWDAFTDYFVLPLINTAIFSNFMGTLDGTGQSTAQFNALPLPGYAGMKMYYAYCLGYPWEFASNPVEIEIVP